MILRPRVLHDKLMREIRPLQPRSGERLQPTAQAVGRKQKTRTSPGRGERKTATPDPGEIEISG